MTDGPVYPVDDLDPTDDREYYEVPIVVILRAKGVSPSDARHRAQFAMESVLASASDFDDADARVITVADESNRVPVGHRIAVTPLDVTSIEDAFAKSTLRVQPTGHATRLALGD